MDKWYLIKSIFAITNYNSSSCFKWMKELFVFPERLHAVKNFLLFLLPTQTALWISLYIYVYISLSTEKGHKLTGVLTKFHRSDHWPIQIQMQVKFVWKFRKWAKWSLINVSIWLIIHVITSHLAIFSFSMFHCFMHQYLG